MFVQIKYVQCKILIVLLVCVAEVQTGAGRRRGPNRGTFVNGPKAPL